MQTHEKELFLGSCVVAECQLASKNILNKKIRESVVVHRLATQLAYKRRVQTKNLLHPSPHFLLEG
jgi:hypothetical protein